MTKGTRLIIAVLMSTGAAAFWLRASAQQAAQLATITATSGQTATLLSDGRWLIVGGDSAPGAAQLVDPITGATGPTAGPLQAPRAWHTATVLPDGTVLVAGGRRDGVLIDTTEIFDPTTGLFTAIPMIGAVARASHSATLLTDGRMLVAGGSNGGVVPLDTEIWDLQSLTATAIAGGAVARSGQTATLLPTGRVLLTGGQQVDGQPPGGVIIIDPVAHTVQTLNAVPELPIIPSVAATIPADASVDVPVDTHLTLRFSAPVVLGSLTDRTLVLTGPAGAVPTKLISAEDGRLAFVWPTSGLEEDTPYTLTVAGPVTRFGVPIVPTVVSFMTTRQASDVNVGDAEAWIPDGESLRNGWRSNRPPSPWEQLPPLVAPPGVTAISGRVLTLDGRPLRNVTLEMAGAGQTTSDRTGRFLLVGPSLGPGRHVLDIEGETASRPGRTYGFFEYGLTVVVGQTNVLSFTIWMPILDTLHTVQIPSPTTSEVVVTTPYIPGLELHIPPNTVIRGENGNPVTQLGITPIPVDRPPFPLAEVEVPVYFTIQPGGGYIYTSGTGLKGAWLVYPNARGGIPGQRVQFYHYDPDQLGWYVYGVGAVAQNAAQVVPDPKTRIYAFTGAMINCCNFSPPGAGPTPDGPPKGDPVDPSTGIFVMHKTDLYLSDVMPLALTRTYESGDTLARPFGHGMTHPYAMFLWSALQYQEADLILPEGSKVHYVRTSSGTGYGNAVFEHTTTPTRFYKSTIAWNGNGWNLTLKDGTVYVFGDEAPLQAIRDRYGNQTTLTWSATNSFGAGVGNILRVTAPNGRWIAFTYDASNRITQASDNVGRTVAYAYDANGNLSTVTDPENNVMTYTWDASNRIATIRDGRNIVYLSNTYTNGRVTQQTLADPNANYQFAYTVDGNGNITQTNVTDPRGNLDRVAFNSSHYITSETQAYGTALARTITTERQTGSNLVTAVTDGLNRRTEYTYDTTGHVLTETRLAGTASAATTTFTYEPAFFQVATVTDPLNHTWTVAYTAGKPTSVTDPLAHQTTMATNTAGQVTTVIDPLNHAWQFGYTDGDLTLVTDPLGGVRTRFVDAAGRLVATTDPIGRLTRTAFDKLNRVTSVTDALGSQTAFSYDENSNLLSLTDALTHNTAWSYDTSDRVATRTDPLNHAASYQYNTNNNATQITDRKTQVTGYEYDALDRLTQVTYADSSTVAYTYDAGDRVAQIVDSANGTITRQYDLLDRLTQETTPQGTVSYTYDADGRRATMTVAAQTAVNYTYDDAHRLTALTQGTATVALAYDNANRRSTLTYPNGIVGTYGYDNANQLTSLAYLLNQTSLGDLTYTYDAAGNRTAVGGTWARTGLPVALTSATYDAANRVTTWAGTAFTYDANGNLTSDGLTSYSWDARDQLIALSGGASASFAYDGIGRRRSKTISGLTTTVLFDERSLVQELTGGGTPTANLLTGLDIDETFTRTDGSGTSTLLVDALRSTLALADASGAVQTQYTFEPFGTTTMSGATSTNSVQFTGRENDGTGSYFYRARYYQPQTARFLSEDPIGRAGGLNFYSYVANNPVNMTDPLGLAPTKSCCKNYQPDCTVRCIHIVSLLPLYFCDGGFAHGCRCPWGYGFFLIPGGTWLPLIPTDLPCSRFGPPCA